MLHICFVARKAAKTDHEYTIHFVSVFSSLNSVDCTWIWKAHLGSSKPLLGAHDKTGFFVTLLIWWGQLWRHYFITCMGRRPRPAHDFRALPVSIWPLWTLDFPLRKRCHLTKLMHRQIYILIDWRTLKTDFLVSSLISCRQFYIISCPSYLWWHG